VISPAAGHGAGTMTLPVWIRLRQTCSGASTSRSLRIQFTGMSAGIGNVPSGAAGLCFGAQVLEEVAEGVEAHTVQCDLALVVEGLFPWM